MKKEATVVMLPTEDKTDILLNTYINETHKSNPFCIGTAGDILKELPVEAIERRGYKYQHLYITTDEEIKEGDWCILMGDYGNPMSTPQQWLGKGVLNNGLRKIIATTDKALIVETWYDSIDLGKQPRYVNLPSIQQAFIEAYCKNPVDKALVEYTLPDKIKNALILGNLSRAKTSDYVLKVNSHNEIIISMIEEKLYTRGEVEDIAWKVVAQSHVARNKGEVSFGDIPPWFDKWIKENL